MNFLYIVHDKKALKRCESNNLGKCPLPPNRYVSLAIDL